MEGLTHASRMLKAVQEEYYEQGHDAEREKKLRAAQRLAEVNKDLIAELRKQITPSAESLPQSDCQSE